MSPRLSDFQLQPSDDDLLAKVPKHFLVCIKRTCAGEKYEDIAASLQIPVGTVKSRVNRGRLLILKLREAAAPAPAEVA